MKNTHPNSDFQTYLIASKGSLEEGQLGSVQLPSLSELSKQLHLSIPTLREQLGIAKAFGWVEVHPRKGIRRLPYTFLPAVRQSLSYAIAMDWSNFLAFSDLRNHIEAAYWDEAVRTLTPEDHLVLRNLINQAWNKLNGDPIQIPHHEHRLLHSCIYNRLKNPFVKGLLEAYWEAYEEYGLNLYAEYKYLQQVWNYHQQMVDAILAGDYDAGYQALVKHKDLLFHRSYPSKEDEDY